MLPALTFLLTAASVFFFALVILGVFQRALEQYKERYVARSMNDLSDMFLFINPGQLFMLNLSVMILLAAFGWWLGGPFLMSLMAIAGFFAPQQFVRHYRAKRIEKFNTQLVESLQQMANAFKAGLTFAQAVETIAKESKPPLAQEFGLFSKEVRLGVPIDEALVNMSGRVGSEDLELVATSTNIARSLGGNMAEMFETIAATIRERFRLEGKIKALTAQGKLQGWIVASMPLALGLFLNWYRPDLMQPMFEHLFGYLLVGAIFLMEFIGIILIRKIVNIDV